MNTFRVGLVETLHLLGAACERQAAREASPRLERFGKGDGYRYETLLQRTGADYEIDLAITVTPSGAISRLEHALEGFDDEQRQYHRRLEEAEQRLVSYRSRDGGAFAFADDLEEKRLKLRAIEAQLSADLDNETVAATA
ncbi:hypothetical protein J2X71_007250 [Rhizobium sp. 1399]|nr:hypothetical protein [Rhizobium sp. 1399]